MMALLNYVYDGNVWVFFQWKVILECCGMLDFYSFPVESNDLKYLSSGWKQIPNWRYVNLNHVLNHDKLISLSSLLTFLIIPFLWSTFHWMPIENCCKGWYNYGRANLFSAGLGRLFETIKCFPIPLRRLDGNILHKFELETLKMDVKKYLENCMRENFYRRVDRVLKIGICSLTLSKIKHMRKYTYTSLYI